MIQAIADGVVGALARTFPDLPIYEDNVEQGFQEPCFYVRELNAKHGRYLDTRYLGEVELAIHYFPPPGEGVTACRDMRAKLAPLLERITTSQGDYLCLDESSEIVDGVLLYFTRYKGYQYEPRQVPYQEELDHQIDVTNPRNDEEQADPETDPPPGTRPGQDPNDSIKPI